MKAIRLGAAEVNMLRELVAEAGQVGRYPIKLARGFLAKLNKAEQPSTNVAVQPIEDSLIAGARGKVVVLLDGHARASVQAGRLGVTPEKAYEVGQYLARTKWLTGPFTLLDVLAKWPTYYSKAQATQPPPSAPMGFGDRNAEARQGTQREGQGPEGGRRAPGFR